MRKIISRMMVLFLASLAVLTPPGLCACWLHPEVENVHPHLSIEHADSDHSHEYLFHLAHTTPAEIIFLVILPATVWMLQAQAGSIWWVLPGTYFREAAWLPAIPLPPPKWDSR